MHFLWASIRKEIKRRFNDPWALFFWLAIPATIGLLMSTVMGGGLGGHYANLKSSVNLCLWHWLNV